MSRDMVKLFAAESLQPDGSCGHWTPGDQVSALASEAGRNARIVSEHITEAEERECALQLLQKAYADRLVTLISCDSNFQQFTRALERQTSRIPAATQPPAAT